MTGFKSKKAAAQAKLTQPEQDATMQSLKDLARLVCDEVGKAAFAQPAQEPAFWLNEQGQLKATRGDAERHSIGQKIIPLYTAPPAAPVQEPIHQWREKHSPYWYDGYPDNEDGGGPYETRTLYTAAKEKNT
jgi:hypothetical protein